MNLRKTSCKFLQSLAILLFFFNTSNGQQKLIGFLNRGALDGDGAAYTINTDGTGFKKNVEFPSAPGLGADMVDGNDGFFYGNTLGNAYGDAGSVFKIKPDGTNYTLLRKFTRLTDGGGIRWRPVVAPDGYLYGVCEDGGQYNNGTIWKLKKDGSEFTLLKTFNTSTENTSGYFGSLLMGQNGKLYGTIGGGNGNIIRINTNGTGFTKLLTFTGGSGSYPGVAPNTPMLSASDGNFYGVCAGGGSGGKGVTFKYNPLTGAYTLLKAFTNDDGAYPGNTPVEAADGYIIGGCSAYGTLNGGTIWRVKKDGSAFSVLKQLDLAVTGNKPGRKLYIHTDGFVYGTLEGYGPANTGTFFKIAQDGSIFNVLRSDFEGGQQPWALIYRESDNRFYIVFNYGGSGNGGYLASVNPDGSGYKHLYTFAYQAEGFAPINTPSVVTDLSSREYGKAFGITGSGGLEANGNLFSYYPAFANQRHTILHNFKTAEGYSPAGRSSVFLGSDGFLYGVLAYGGPVTGNSGTAYRINPQDTTTFTIIKSFGNYGTSPTGTTIPGDMMEAPDGYLYGTTSQTGVNNRGAIFKMQKDGSNYSNIYQFGGSNTLFGGGGFIYDPATQKLIGIGTLSNNDGVIFSINTDGTSPSIIKTFAYADGATNGFGLSAPLKLQNDTLYGTAGAGPSNFGLIYKIHKNGTGFSVIKSFVNTEGGTPYGNLQIGEDGYLYGTCGGTVYLSSGANVYKIRKDGSDFTILKNFGTDLNSLEGNAPGTPVLLPCSTPQNAAEIVFGNATRNSITLSGFTPPASGGVTGYVIKINTINTFTPPANGSTPTASTLYGGSGEQVIYSGTSVAPVTVTGLSPNTQYWFKVFAYGCTGTLYTNTSTTNNPNSQRTTPNGIERHVNLMARLDGVNDYVNAGDVNALEDNSAISFGGWVKPQSFPADNFKVKSFVAKGDGINPGATSFQAGLYKNDGSQLMVVAQISIDGEMAKVETVIDSSMFRINQWSHYFVTWQSGQKIKLYINGRMVIQSAITYSGTVNNITAGLKLGSSDAGSNEENFHGDMEEMQFYNIALSQCDIRQRKHITLTGAEPGLVAYYQFNEDDGMPTFKDYINAHNGSKQNGILALESDLSAGGGNSECISVQSTDYSYNFDAIDHSNRLELTFPVLSPDGLLNGSYIQDVPVGGNPNPGSNMLPGYWIINNFGNNQSGLNATLTFRFADGILTDANTDNYHLYKRPSNGSGPWEVYPVTAVSLEPGNNVITINGIPGFSQLVLTSELSTLPLDLISFQGSLFNSNATLEWKTSNEMNISKFQLERKLPGENSFTVITNVNAKNTASNYYSYIDKTLPAGITWYRLRIADKDGKKTYSNIITVNNKAKAIVVFPNPVADVLHVINPVTNSKAKAIIFSADGRAVLNNIAILSNTTHINVRNLPRGTYILKCMDEDGNASFTKFAKQ